MKMKLREGKDPIKHQSEESPWRYTPLPHSVQHVDCRLKMFMTEASVPVSVKYMFAECAAILGGRAELPSKAENHEPRGSQQIAT